MNDNEEKKEKQKVKLPELKMKTWYSARREKETNTTDRQVQKNNKTSREQRNDKKRVSWKKDYVEVVEIESRKINNGPKLNKKTAEKVNDCCNIF